MQIQDAELFELKQQVDSDLLVRHNANNIPIYLFILSVYTIWAKNQVNQL